MTPSLRTITLAVGLLAAASTPLIATAQSCTSLKSSLGALRSQITGLAVENPGSSMVWGACVTTAASELSRSGDTATAVASYMLCASVACMLADSYGNCLNVQRQLIGAAIRADGLNRQIQATCRSE